MFCSGAPAVCRCFSRFAVTIAARLNARVTFRSSLRATQSLGCVRAGCGGRPLQRVQSSTFPMEERMASKLKIKVNGLVHGVTASLDTPLLYVLHNELHLHGPRFGCGLAQCGACSVLLDGKEIRSCVTPVAAVSGKAITTLEGLPALWAKERGTSAAAPVLHPLQQAWIDVQVPHCGYCQNGMMIQAADLLSTTKNPTEDQIRTAMNGHLCRCGTYPRILTAIKQAAAVMAKGGK